MPTIDEYELEILSSYEKGKLKSIAAKSELAKLEAAARATAINSMTYKGYTASMVFDAEDKIVVGRVLEIDDIISFHGESVSEFEANFHAAIDDYLAAARELRLR